MADYDLGTARGSIVLNAASLLRAQAALRATGIAMLGIGGLAVAGFALAVGASAKFEEQLSRFSAVTGASEKDMEKLRQKALELGADSAFGATKVAEAFVELGKSGLAAKDVLAGVGDAAVHLAAAGELDMARATEILVNTMRTFNLSAEDAVKISDLLAAGANASTVEVEDLAVSLRYVGNVASALGLTLEDTITALALLGNEGIKGSTAGTSLRGILVALQPASEKAKKKLEELGIITADGANQFFDAEGKAKSFSEIIDVLKTATAGMTTEQKVAALNTVFQRRALASVLALISTGPNEFKKLKKEMGKITAEEVMREKLDNLSGALKQLRASLETTLIKAGAPFQDVLKKMVLALREVVNWFGNLSPQTQKVISSIVLFGGAALLVAGGIAILLGSLFKIYRVFKDVAAALRILGAAFKLFSAGLLTNPVFLIIAALVLLGIALFVLYKKNKAFRDFVDKAWDEISQFVKKAWEKIQPVLEAFAAWLKDTLLPAAKKTINWIKDNWQGLLAALGVITGTIGIMLLIKHFESIKNAVTSTIDFVRENWVRIAGIFLLPLTPIIAAIFLFTNNWEKAWSVIGPVVRVAVAYIRTIVNAWIAWFKFVWAAWGDDILNLLRDTWDFIVRTFRNVFNIIKNVIQLVLNLIEGDWGEAWNNFLNILRAIWDQILNYLRLGWEQLKGILAMGLSALKALWDLAWEGIKAALSAIWDTIVSLVRDSIEGVKSVIEFQLGLLKTAWDTIWNGILGFIGGVWELIKSVVSNGIQAVVTFVTELPGKVAGALQDLVGRFLSAGTDALNAFIGAIFALPERLWSWAGDIWNGVKNVIGNFTELGRQAIEAFINALVNVPGYLWDKVKDIGRSIADALNPAGSPHVVAWYAGAKAAEEFTKGLARQMAKQESIVRSMMSDFPISTQSNMDRLGAAVGAGLLPTRGTSDSAMLERLLAALQNAGDGGFTYNNYAREVDAEEIVDEYFWGKRFGRAS